MDFRAYKLADREAYFKKNLVDSYGKKWTAGISEFAGVIRLRTTDSTGYYNPQKIQKLKIWVHSTAGLGPGVDIGELSKPNNKVSVPYVIGRDGQIYKIFPDEAWSWHLGPNSSAPNSYWSSHSVGIELCNIGPLEEDATDPNVLLDTYGKPYCTKADTQFYAPSDYRGFKYFATYTDEQYKSLDFLVRCLCKKFSIPMTKIPTEHIYDWFDRIPDVGIVSHVNCRKDKYDLPPVFDWSRIAATA